MGKKLLKTATAVSATYGLASFLTFYEVMGKNAKLQKKFVKLFDKPKPKTQPTEEQMAIKRDLQERLDWFHEQEFTEYSIVSNSGNQLRGYYLPAEKPSNIFVFCSHGYRCTGKGEFRYFSKYYHDKGFNLFYADHQAAGESDGKYIGFGYHEAPDCLKWLQFMNSTFGNDIQIILHGVSMGSATVMLMTGSGKLPANVKFTVADCGYTSAWEEFEHNTDSLGKAKYGLLYGADFFNKLISGYHFKDADPIHAVTRARIPMLFVHGDKDDFVPTKMVYSLYDACTAPYKDLLIVEGAGHAASYKVNPRAYEKKLEEFFNKYLDAEKVNG